MAMPRLTAHGGELIPMKTLILSLAIAATISGCSSTNRLTATKSTAAIGAVGGYAVGAYAGRRGSGASGDYLYQQHSR